MTSKFMKFVYDWLVFTHQLNTQIRNLLMVNLKASVVFVNVIAGVKKFVSDGSQILFQGTYQGIPGKSTFIW